jgi:S-adenosylmethionine:tRNA ribosyltransferase-isomerase
MRRRDFHYDLPRRLIAQAPLAQRDRSRLLVVGDQLADRHIGDLPGLLAANAVVVFNDTRVIPARLRANKASGGAVELLLLHRLDGAKEHWRCLARSSKPLRGGARLQLGGGPAVQVVESRADDGTLVIELPEPADALMAAHGEVPLPPYVERPAGPTPADLERYQTVFARKPGAVAAPTAGLHFTPELMAQLPEVAYVTLHVGPGTFAPVRAERLDDHVMHSERFSIPARTAELVASGRPVVAVGTTVARALEAAAAGDRDTTRLFIRPGFRFRVIDQLLTNFHLPESTLLMLVSAFAGHERTMAAYRHAVAAEYRFYSYGDAMLVSR